MRNTKLVAGLSVTALAALGITTAVVTNHNKDAKNAEDKNVQVEAEASVEYTGELFVSSTLSSKTEEAVAENKVLTEQTGTLMCSGAGASETLEEYGSYMAVADSATSNASVEALDVALKFVPEGSVIEGYTNLGVSNVTSYLNVREDAGTGNEIIGKMPGGSACEILGEKDGWYEIQSGDVKGYVAKEYISTGYDANVKAMETMSQALKVTADVLNVREEPSQDCSISDRVQNGEILEILEAENNGWYKVNINNLEGYVSAEYVESIYTLPVAEKIVRYVASSGNNGSGSSGLTYDSSNLDQTVSQTAVDLINYAYQFLGNPYVYGGNSLTNGTDCSGFTKLVFAQFGYNLPRTSLSYANVGTRISTSDAKPGDIFVYKYSGGGGHVAIYIGEGKIIHAGTERTGICIGNAYFTTPLCAVRVIP